MEKVYLTHMFPDYEPPEELITALSQAAIVAADLDPETRSVEVALYSDTYIPQRLLDRAGKDIASLYGLRSLILKAAHPASQLSRIEPGELMQLFVSLDSMSRASLAGATWEWEDTTLTVKLLANGKHALEELIPQVQQNLRERFAAPVTIRIEAGKTLEGQALYDAMESLRDTVLSSMPAAARSEKPAQAAAPAQPDTFYGKPFKTPPILMKDIDLNMATITVQGQVFNVDHKELKKRNAWVVKFDITDNTDSIRVSKFMEANEAKPILENVKPGAILQIQGKLTEDRYDNEMVLRPYAMQPGSLPKRKDTAQGMKRVELHLHTTMSNMDALTSTKAAIKQAAAWATRPSPSPTTAAASPLPTRCMWWKTGRDLPRWPVPTKPSRSSTAARATTSTTWTTGSWFTAAGICPSTRNT